MISLYSYLAEDWISLSESDPQAFIQEVENRCIIQGDFKEYIQLIKHGSRVTCTNCGHQFYRIEKVAVRSGFDVECNHCKHRWRFMGTAKRTSCPNCEEKVYPEKCRVKADDVPDISV